MPNLFGRGELIHKGTRDNPGIDVYECCDCGTKYLSIIDKANDYESGFMYATNNLADLDINARLRLFRADDLRRYSMCSEICKGKKVLDFGCGFGGFLNCISKISNYCCGVELGEEERGYLNQEGICCFKSLEELGRKFDVITLFHTFEHLSTPDVWLKKFNEYLMEGGYLIIEVPNANDALLSLYKSEKFADFTYWSAHLFLYTIKSLSMVIERVDKFNIISSGQVQRYPLANHLMWLSNGLPGGQNIWKDLCGRELDEAYAKKLEELQMCDTLFFILQKK